MDREYFQQLKEQKTPLSTINQRKRLYNLLSNGIAHSTREICRVVYGAEHLGLSRVSARIWDLEHLDGQTFLDKNGNEITEKGKMRCWRDDHVKSINWYRMKIAIPEPLKIEGFGKLDFERGCFIPEQEQLALKL